ncbi:BTB/POZ domain-containing protein [Aspergillus homomorphus CBS 101889]|uniref:BTB domain-containing protein n=1 Tax=Aspergillus homomorphus (strain CBS 101889) TaxID=1450537 RepID=A0A395HFI3_ASPHC|nr:hypothetical protein BO97DRAFT_380086 [Aspergillus homomorphus CBS 101889]RAL06617.1 hypothetical protein BO97DRAFT_380086 [Aspergillus homomorphus CBS 101889]
MPGTNEIAYIDFLDSDFVSLRVRQTGRSFRIHRKLLQSKSRPLIAALDSTLLEGQNFLYEFEDVKEGTVARFIEWAYRGDYPTPIIILEPLPPSFNPEKVDTDIEDKPTTKTPEMDFTSENHPLLVHIRLYIFSHLYIIPELQKLAYEKVTACFADLDKPDGLDKQLAVIDALRLCLSKLSQNDTLLDWLAQYAAYSIDKLRLQGSFHDLLKDFPSLSSRMMISLNPAQSPPWRSTQQKYQFTQYSARWTGDIYDI